MALTDLARDPRMLRTRLVVIDFEALTPAGRPPEPTEVAAITLICRPDGTLEELGRFDSLMRPPADVPITARDQDTGITPALLAAARPAAVVMADLDRHVSGAAAAAGDAVRLIAHSAGTERSLIHGKREHCPGLAATPLLDTVRLARAGLPGLTEHGLSQVASFFGIALPVDRHRALADVELTIAILRALIERSAWSTLLDLERTAHMPPKPADTPAAEQSGLF